jgi:tetrahydrodipicolinate N-succinyltransferase
MRVLAASFLSAYRLAHRVWGKLFSLCVGPAFQSFGRRTVIEPPVRIGGEARIAVGHGVFVGGGSWLQALPDGASREVALRIGDGCMLGGCCVLSAIRGVTLEDEVLVARNVYISDHIHHYQDTSRPIRRQGIDKVAPVVVGRGAWLGQNVIVCPGVRIGRGAVVGGNSVVTEDIPDFSVAVGAPARVVKRFGPAAPELVATGLQGAAECPAS